jgi:hypothetical protein
LQTNAENEGARWIARDEMTSPVLNVTTAYIGSCHEFITIECWR